VPLHYQKLRREDIQPIVDKIIKRIAGCKNRLLSYGTRITLLKICLASIPIYMTSVIKFPKWVVEAIKSQMANFIWNDQENNRKYHLSNWQSLAQKKKFGDLNLCLLASWVQRYYDAESRLWRDIIDHKYNGCSPNLFCCNPRNASPFLKGWCSQPRLENWTIDEIWEMGGKWDFGKIFGLALAPWPSSFGTYIL
jgi:hypothetical protein